MSEDERKVGETTPSKPENREAIWAIRTRWTTLYLVLFTIQVVVGFGIALYDGISTSTPDAWKETYFDIILRTGQVGIASAIISFAAIEILDIIMLMSEWIRFKLVEPAKERQRETIERRLEEGRTEGRRQGLNAANEAALEWFRRYEEANRKGEHLDEDPPFMQNGKSDQRSD